MNGYIKTDKVFLFFAIFAVTFILFVLRRPDLITNPQFWAEDGRYWYHQAYTLGPLHSIILPQNGYYQSISKITASLSLALPLWCAPIFFNVIAISIRCFVVMFLLSSRMSSYKLLPRFILAIFIIAMPHVSEVHANITNAHWYLSMWLFMVIISNKPDGTYWKMHDFLILLLSGLSGPFIVFLAPVVALKLVDGRVFQNPFKTIRNAIRNLDAFSIAFIFVCLIQVVAILISSTADRSQAPLGASLDLLITILSSKIFAGFALTTAKTIELWNSGIYNYVICLISIAIICCVLIKGTWREWSMVIFPALMIGFALAKPMISNTEPQWSIIMSGGAERYFVIPNVFWASILLSFLGGFNSWSKYLHSAFLVVILVMSHYTYKLKTLPDNKWIESVNAFENAPAGDEVSLPINPRGWVMVLEKK
ncbi:TPA: glucosyl transferase [Enterobacter hormaechei]|uniref:hypothetical protein n=1 Tax=Enterobacter hormaechei TaxID=158836 RepID=UPI000528208C|nr:hypothetical protein [Enterobacter hormaechei]ASO98880.1 hypothetical protein MS7884_0563 [Enterobacter hormaechei]HAS1295266.1 glucosyl transferase [Enterobacter hormaechei]HAS1432766.1 glucosyl transferase [Enterobacter hormaechei]HAT7700289.1 glucosyl transferase [Enterobacter hormaechei]HCD3738743.1 glucosyl transferase [Enterobacter hormaechei]